MLVGFVATQDAVCCCRCCCLICCRLLCSTGLLGILGNRCFKQCIIIVTCRAVAHALFALVFPPTLAHGNEENTAHGATGCFGRWSEKVDHDG